jgi:plastocyanin
MIAGLALLGAPAGAPAETHAVNAQFSEFGPTPLDLLPGESVEWINVSERRHTVTSDAGLFESGDLFSGDRFARQFDEVGAYPYHCTVHEGMVGEIDVRRVILSPLPTAAVPFGDRVDFTGRAADPARPVRIERSADGTTFTTVGTATPASDGIWSTKVSAEITGDYRAASGAEVSQSRRLLVSSRRVLLRATRAGVRVTVSPSSPYARIVLQLDLRERFGWWPVFSTRLDYVSQADFRVRRPARVRVLLVDKDGWTPLATSPVLVIGQAKHARAGS